MSIHSMGLSRPGIDPYQPRRITYGRKRESAAPPSGRNFDTARVRERPQPPQGTDTEAALGRLHEMGLLEKVSRPMNMEGEPSARPEPDLPSLHVRNGGRPPEPAGPRAADRPEPPAEGRIYGRPAPRGPEPPGPPVRDNGVFTIRLFRPKTDTGRTLDVGGVSIPVEEDGSVLAGMPDGSVRRITINQDVLNRMVESGQAWLTQDRPAGPAPMGPPPEQVRGHGGLRAAIPDDGGGEDALALEDAADAKETGIAEARAGSKSNAALVNRLKAELQQRQAQLFHTVRDMLNRQGAKASGGIWKTLAGGNYKADAAASAEARQNISEDGYWGVEQTSDRIVQFAAALIGGDPDKLDSMIAAFEKGYAEAEKAWGGMLPEICRKTKERVYEKFEELRKQCARETDASGDS